jgi:NDP-sugar pyrophosphorylase family protein
MVDSVAGVVLAAGLGRRLRPLTTVRPKPLCPVGDVPLVDLAIERASTLTTSIAVNVHAFRAELQAHLGGRVHLSIEDEPGLGTAGALGVLRSWIDGRPTLVLNADAWCPGPLDHLAAGWEGDRIRLLVVGSDEFGPRSQIAGALLPWTDVAPLQPVPSGLYEASWSAAQRAGRIEVVRHDGPFVDCGTPERYLAANLAASGGESVIGAGATVAGTVVRSVVWGGARVHPREVLVDAIRYGRDSTVLVRRTGASTATDARS